MEEMGRRRTDYFLKISKVHLTDILMKVGHIQIGEEVRELQSNADGSWRVLIDLRRERDLT